MFNRLGLKKLGKIKNFLTLYTSGLGRNDIELLLKKDTVDAFSYLKAKTDLEKQTDQPKSLKFYIRAARKIFLSFVMQLSPARRLVYGIGFILFIAGIFYTDKAYILFSFLVLNLLLALELVDKLTTRDELEIAREIQLSLQPSHIPTTDQFSFSTYSEPARIVGGDFYDIIRPADDKIISIIGDVSDKGVSAALYAVYTQSVFQSLSETQTSPSRIMESLNEVIGKRLRDGDFVTAAVALFDPKEKSVTITRAGHNWPLHYCARTRDISELKPKGPSIGMIDNPQFSNQLEEHKIFLEKGDFLLLYTDGITEAFDGENRMFDITGLKSAIRETAHKSSKEIIDHINHQLNNFTDCGELHDDATMVAVKIN
ncbi:MAG: serine/threonine-protein phosphatase [Desulfobacteraceae bacterium]|nr:MAG: serine/threonine-protein phosphatase [Desulfobacteraceae bacterium]